MLSQSSVNQENSLHDDEQTEYRLPFADAPSIIQSNQKDEQIISVLVNKLENFLKVFKGQLFINLYPKEIASVAKAIYLIVTTLSNKKTLGEEFTELVYVNRDGRSFVRRYKKLLFVVSYILGPFMIRKCLKKILNRGYMNSQDSQGTDDTPNGEGNLRYIDILDKMLNIHLLIFYLNGSYYNISKRVFGMRYALGRPSTKEENDVRDNNTLFPTFSLDLFRKGKTSISEESDPDHKYLTQIPKKGSNKHLKLMDDTQFPFIPSESRDCTLCLSKMTDPSIGPCGHVFCWDCIIDWCKERPECPLCRQKCEMQQIIVIK